MQEVVFIVEEFDKHGDIVTLSDKFYANFPNFDYWWYGWIKEAYKENTGTKIKYRSFSSIKTFDPNKRYFYFIPIAQWLNDFHNWFLLFGKTKMKTLADNNVTILFAYDFEHLPAFNIDYFIQSFEWFYSMLIEHGNTNLKFNFLTQITM